MTSATNRNAQRNAFLGRQQHFRRTISDETSNLVCFNFATQALVVRKANFRKKNELKETKKMVSSCNEFFHTTVLQSVAWKT